jgi:hypothetical protein
MSAQDENRDEEGSEGEMSEEEIVAWCKIRDRQSQNSQQSQM